MCPFCRENENDVLRTTLRIELSGRGLTAIPMPSVSTVLWDDSVRFKEAQTVTSSHACRVVRPGARTASDPPKSQRLSRCPFLKYSIDHSGGRVPFTYLQEASHDRLWVMQRPQEDSGGPLGRSSGVVKGSGNTGGGAGLSKLYPPPPTQSRHYFPQ